MTISTLQPNEVELISEVVEQVWADVGAHYPPTDPRTDELRRRVARIVLDIAGHEPETRAEIALKAALAFRQSMRSTRKDFVGRYRRGPGRN
jgi:hypothetical protein